MSEGGDESRKAKKLKGGMLRGIKILQKLNIF